MTLEIDAIVSIKLNSGEELVTKILKQKDELGFITISEPVSVAPSNQGLGLIPSLFTSDPKGEYRLNINNITLYAEADEGVKAKYVEAITGLKIPSKKLVLG